MSSFVISSSCTGRQQQHGDESDSVLGESPREIVFNDASTFSVQFQPSDLLLNDPNSPHNGDSNSQESKRSSISAITFDEANPILRLLPAKLWAQWICISSLVLMGLGSVTVAGVCLADFCSISAVESSNSNVLMASPSVAPTMAPSLQSFPREPIRTLDELHVAIDNFLATGLPNSIHGPIEQWDVSQLTSLDNAFDALRSRMAAGFNRDISQWNTSQVASMVRTFAGAAAFDGDLSQWDTSNVVSLRETFAGATSFRGGNLRSWNVSAVQTTEGMCTYLRCLL